jgi:hypothetical protein
MAKKKSRKKAGRRGGTKRKAARKAKGHIPLKILEKRQKRLTSIVKSRGGHVSK